MPLASGPVLRRQGQGGSPIAVVVSWFYVREGDLGLWLAAYLTKAVRGRYGPVLTGTAITAYVLWLVLSPGERGARTIEGVIVCDVLAVMCQRTTCQVRQRRVWILGEASTKGPLKREKTNNRQARQSIQAVFLWPGSHFVM